MGKNTPKTTNDPRAVTNTEYKITKTINHTYKGNKEMPRDVASLIYSKHLITGAYLSAYSLQYS